MFTLTDDEEEAVQRLGSRLRRRRLMLEERQVTAAARLGVSLPTLRKLEQGSPTVAIGTWVRAIRLYGSLGDLESLLTESLFDEAADRQRAPRHKP